MCWVDGESQQRAINHTGWGVYWVGGGVGLRHGWSWGLDGRGLRVPWRIWMCWQEQWARCEQNKLAPMSPPKKRRLGADWARAWTQQMCFAFTLKAPACMEEFQRNFELYWIRCIILFIYSYRHSTHFHISHQCFLLPSASKSWYFNLISFPVSYYLLLKLWLCKTHWNAT